MGLWARLALLNACVVVGAFVVLIVSPAAIAYPMDAGEATSLVVIVLSLLVVESVLIARVLAPLRQMRDAMAGVERPTDHLPELVARRDEVGDVARAFRGMLQRLAAERHSAGRRAIGAQEEERRRVARELHDEVGQNLTVLMLEAAALRAGADPVTAAGLQGLTDRLRTILEEVRGISTRLRPGALDDLGLEGAVRALVNDLHRQGQVRIQVEVEGLPALDGEEELVVYRITQEALTNVLRHSGGSRAEVRVVGEGAGLTLTVTDDGVGVSGEPRTGMLGMQERARLVGGRLELVAAEPRGTTVRFWMPVAVTGS